MNYGVVSENSTATLTKRVDELIAKGWVPLGGVSAVQDGTDHKLYQAMTKKED